jgi:Glycosyl transferase family 2
MKGDNNPACAAPLVEVRPGGERLSVAPAADLPRDVVHILRQRGIVSGPVLLLADGSLRPRNVKATAQFQLTCGTVSEAALLSGADFVAVVVILRGPRARKLDSILTGISARLAPDAPLVLILPTSHLSFSDPPGDRQTALAAHGRSADHRESLHLTLLRCGYDRVWAHSHRRALCISAKRACATGGARTCSIIVPVYNEKDTFPQLMRSLLAKRLDHLGLEREIIVVESNSTDGSRELVAAFAAVPGVKIFWQDRPRGKGHAVREGLRVATGDIVLIQDADLEYDVNDYDALLEPLLQDRAAFVLGSRHSGEARMRRFTDRPLLGDVLNFGHLFFTTLINVLYGQSLKDPFTMFKVFRRDCLYGLELECNRFDFDHELVIKLALKGYRALEIPVNYCSRSFKQGKKIHVFRDPLTWVFADMKYRLQPLRPRLE